MIVLILAILTSSFIFILFKLFPKYSIDTFQAIVFNYVTAFVCGITFFGDQWNENSLLNKNWINYAIICGLLFISLFYLMGLSSQKNGVALTSIAVKMSMVMTLFFMIVFYGESFTLIKFLAIIAALGGIFLVAHQKTDNLTSKSYKWILIVLFLGSALLDVLLNYVQKFELSNFSTALFSAAGFGFAGIFGLIVILIKYMIGKEKLQFKSVIAGVMLGIPNYFSIYFLLESYNTVNLNDSTVLALINLSIVIISALIGFLLFRENITKRKILGLIFSLISISLLYFTTNN